MVPDPPVQVHEVKRTTTNMRMNRTGERKKKKTGAFTSFQSVEVDSSCDSP